MFPHVYFDLSYVQLLYIWLHLVMISSRAHLQLCLMSTMTSLTPSKLWTCFIKKGLTKDFCNVCKQTMILSFVLKGYLLMSNFKRFLHNKYIYFYHLRFFCCLRWYGLPGCFKIKIGRPWSKMTSVVVHFVYR